MFKKKIITFGMILLFPICSCGGVDYGQVTTKTDFEQAIERQSSATGILSTAYITYECSGTLNGVKQPVTIGKFNGKVSDYDSTNEEQKIAMETITTYSYPFIKTMYITVPEETKTYFINKNSEFTLMIDYAGQETTSQARVAVTIEATYRWDFHGNIIYIDEKTNSDILIDEKIVSSTSNRKLNSSYTYA